MEQVLELFTEKSKFLLIAGVVFLLLEILRPARRQRKWRMGSGLDLIYAFTVPLIVYPASVLFNTWLIEQFWPTLPNTGPRQQIIAQAPEHGQVIIELSGAVTYHPNSGFQGIDRYTIATEHNQNTIRQTFLVKVASPIPASDVSGQNASSAIYIAEVNKKVSGKVTEGISGFFFHFRQTIQEWNLGLQLLIATFLIDLTGYWRHRLMHTRFLWPFHAIHHSSKELDWLSNERFHPVNACITSLLGMAVLILFFKDPFVFALAIPLRAAYGMFIHSNVKISYGAFDTVFASPLFHHWHHAANEMANKNYCTFFSFLDRMFGTYYLPKDKGNPASLGLAKDDLANRYWSQLAYPFIKLASQKPTDPSR
jgi:sterol desaturase/sphingolipid hydroxylase (fatty acid hydroxylase superfamily)